MTGNPKIRVGVLDLAYWPEEYMSGAPKFGEVMASWMAHGLPEADYTVIDVIEGAPLPDVDAFDVIAITGSADGVYDTPAYMAPLRDFLPKLRDAGVPMVGICFGHQIMADVFGGKAEKVGPPEVGVRHFQLGDSQVPAHVWHQDQVTQVPPGAKVIAAAEYCPNAGLEYDFPAISVQFHPEYEAGYLSSFLSRGKGDLLNDTDTERALDEIANGGVDRTLFSEQAARMVRAALLD